MFVLNLSNLIPIILLHTLLCLRECLASHSDVSPNLTPSTLSPPRPIDMSSSALLNDALDSNFPFVARFDYTR